ncbi:hypothetical protein EDD21DRAFT_401330 [Dissophora ornata]|nr:hypothetical protein EDD21DRAFT_401330 [Dissophora ornata]
MPSSSIATPALGAMTSLKRTNMTAMKSTTFRDGTKTIQEANLTVTGLSKLHATNMASTTTKMKEEGPYAKELAAMEKKFMDYIHNTEIWEKVYEDSSAMSAPNSNSSWIQVFQYKDRPMCYKIIALMNNTAAVTFDTLCDLDRRSEWDPMCVEAKVLEEVSPPGSTIQYVRTKAVWPTASRDTVVLGTVKDLGSGGLFMVNSSIEHASMPERVKEKIVRMETTVAGHVITPEEGNRCKLVQILDADLKGWIPDKVIQMVSTKAVPDGLRAVNKIIPNITPYLKSKVLVKAAQAQMQADSILLERRFGSNPEESMLELREKIPIEDMDPADRELEQEDETESDDDDVEKSVAETLLEGEERTHTLRRQRSEGDVSLSKLSDRLKVVEAEIGGLRSRQRSGKDTESVGGDHEDTAKRSATRTTKSSSRALEKARTTSTFGVFWEGIKENLGFGLGGKVNKIIVAAIVIAIFGASIAKLKRR